MKVLQLIDSLNAGGAERMAVNLANSLINQIDASYLVCTRKEGIFKKSIQPGVSYTFLKKKSKFDISAYYRLFLLIKTNKISIVHAHSSSFFMMTIVTLFLPRVKTIWHDHYGNSMFLSERSKLILKLCSFKFSHIFAVNTILKQWAEKNLNCSSVSFMPNFVIKDHSKQDGRQLHGYEGKRILCLANLRPQKDHVTLLQAMSLLLKKHKQFQDWTLHCVGQDFGDDYSKKLCTLSEKLSLDKHVFFYGSRSDVASVIECCDIGVLSSKSEGLPLALIEYGLGKLAVIATDVGDCSAVIRSEEHGLLIKPQSPTLLANGLSKLILNKNLCIQMGNKLNEEVEMNFSLSGNINLLIQVYKKK